MAETVVVTVERFGGGDVLVNDAGLHMGRYNLTSTLSLQEWRRLAFSTSTCSARFAADQAHER